MSKIKNAAIILLGIGEKAAAEVLKTMDPKDVRAIIEAINSIDNVNEEEVLTALNDFFTESNHSAGIDLRAKDKIKSSLMNVIGASGFSSFTQSDGVDKDLWLDLLRAQPAESIVDLIQDEHPQVITAIVIIIFNNISSENGTKLIKALPKELQNQVFIRMTRIGYISKFAIETLATYFKSELESSHRNNMVTVDGLETVANIVSYLDNETETRIIGELTNNNKDLVEKIQDKMFPFPRLAELDKKSLQILLNEIKNDDLVLALKGVDEHVKEVFLSNMSAKSAEILKDDMETKGPVKIAHVIDAQKNIIRIAKKLDQEEKIILTTKNNPDIVY